MTPDPGPTTALPWLAFVPTATLVNAPVIDVVRSIGVAVWKAIVTLLLPAMGAAVIVILTVPGTDVPPGPVAV